MYFFIAHNFSSTENRCQILGVSKTRHPLVYVILIVVLS